MTCLLSTMVDWTFATSDILSSHIHKLVSFFFFSLAALVLTLLCSETVSSLDILVSLEVIISVALIFPVVWITIVLTLLCSEIVSSLVILVLLEVIIWVA